MLSLPYDISCGYFDSNNPKSTKHPVERTVKKFEIEFFSDDNMFVSLDGHKYAIQKNTMLIARPGQLRYTGRPFKTTYLCFNIDGELAERLYAAPEFFICSHPEQIHKMLEELALLVNIKNNDLLMHSRFLKFLDFVLKDSSIPQQYSGRNYKIIQTAKRYMENNYATALHLEDIAATVNLSPIYFHSIFSMALGQSPHEYLTKIRIEQAKKLLWDSSVPISDVAERCGFGSQQYFTKIFKKETGSSPGKYRKSLYEDYVE